MVWFARLVFEFAPRIHHCPRLICQSVNLARRGLHRIADAMQAAGCVLERSREYPNRGGSGYVRVYLDCDLHEEVEDDD